MGEPRTSGLELQTDQGIGCLCPGDGYLLGSLIHVHVTAMTDSKSETEAGFVRDRSLHRSRYGQRCHRGLEWDTPCKTKGRGKVWIHT